MSSPSIFVAFLVGFASFISPCVLPLVPGYLSAVSGLSLAEIEQGDARLRRVLLPALIFCASFTLVFVILGLSASGLGQLFSEHRQLIETIAGVVIILFGLFFIAAPFVTRLNREWRPEFLIERLSKAGPVVIGIAFAVAWTPCIGPTLGAILTLAATSDNTASGAVLLFFYASGLALPFLLSAVLFNRAMVAFRFLRNHWLWITFLSGIVLIVIGALMITGQLTYLNIEAQRLLNSLGLDFLYQI